MTIEKLIAYLASIEYWQNPDNGMWEEYEEVHASSVGACLAGLIAISQHFDVSEHLIVHGRNTLDALLPRESASKDVDLALLSLIYPYQIVSVEQRNLILRNVEGQLVRARGVIRYKGDLYYNRGGEAEWTMGLPWLAIIYKQLGDKARFELYMKQTLEAMNSRGELPELYYADSQEHNDNSPLGWAQSLYLVAVL